MSTPQGCTDGKDVIESFKEALKQRVGQECFQIWFSGIRFEFRHAENVPQIVVIAGGQFAADRLSKNYLSAIRGATASVCGSNATVSVEVVAPRQVELPFAEPSGGEAKGSSKIDGNAEQQRVKADKSGPPSNAVAKRRGRNSSGRNSSGRGATQSLHAILRDGTNSRKPQLAPTDPQPSLLEAQGALADEPDERSANPPSVSPIQSAGPTTSSREGASAKTAYAWDRFVAGDCNQLARTACQMAIQSPAVASPLVLWGPPGSGKTHLLHAVAGKLRSVHRMRRVIYLPAEDFTNDFIRALNGNSLPAFRARFRDVDALLIDDIQFFVDKKATIRELHHTVEMLAEFRKPLLFAGSKAPTEITGLGSELAGRLSSGLVCQVQSLDQSARESLLSSYAKERCSIDWPSETLGEIAGQAEGDGRVLSGIVNLVALLQQMYGQMPTMDQIRQHGSHLLRSAGVPITLSSIERAVEKVFQLDSKSLQSGSQTKSITEPRMLAMYLSREMTSSAFSEIGGHFGGRSHSTAILASQRVQQWLQANKAIGRGRSAIAAEDAIRRVESMLKTG